jgi:hypothetical protein
LPVSQRPLSQLLQSSFLHTDRMLQTVVLMKLRDGGGLNWSEYL